MTDSCYFLRRKKLLTMDDLAELMADFTGGKKEHALDLVRDALARGLVMPEEMELSSKENDALNMIDKDDPPRRAELKLLIPLDTMIQRENADKWLETIAISITDRARKNGKRISNFAMQEAAIISKITELGYDPKNLTKNDPGKSGIKSIVKKALGDKGIWQGTVFKKAWERLSENADIKYNK